MTGTAAARARGTRLVSLEGGDPPKKKKARRRDGYDRVNGAKKKAAAAGPEVHRLIEQYDTRGLRRHLKARPAEVNAKNADGDAPIHVIAAKGAVMVAEALEEFHPDHLASNRRGLLGGHLAAEKHPKTAQFLFEHALAQTDDEGSWYSTAEIEAKLAGLAGKAAAAIDEAAAGLCGIPVSELNTPADIVKNRTHLEAVKGMVLDVKSEGWWQDQFVPHRVRALMRATLVAPKEMRSSLIREIEVQLDLLRTARRATATSKCGKEQIRERAMTLEARQVLARVGRAPPLAETALAFGWTGHAFYCGLTRVEANRQAGHPQDTLLIRIDNLGAGSSKAHDHDGSQVYSRAFHVPTTYLQSDEGGAALQAFVRDVLLVRASPETNEEDFYARVAEFKSDVKKATGAGDSVESEYRARGRSTLKQIAGNCVVANTFPGLAGRLGDATFEWFRDFERALARELVDAHADTNRLIDEACKERDQREITRVLEEPGPWAEKLRAIIDGAKATYDVSTMAKTLTADQMKKIIDGGDGKALKLLLSHGARVDLQDANDATPLHWAVAAANVEMVTALLDRRAAVNAMDKAGDTPLHLAVRAASNPVAAVLLDRGADLDRENKAKVTPRAALKDLADSALLIARTVERRPRTRLRARPP